VRRLFGTASPEADAKASGVQPGSVVVISGPAGAGKSSVARQLARTSAHEHAVHLHTDDFYAAIVKGFIDPRRVEAHAQNTVVVEAFTASAKRFALGGFAVVVDGVVGPWFLAPWQALVRDGLDVHYLVLRPDEPTTLARGTARTTAGALTDAQALTNIWQAFATWAPSNLTSWTPRRSPSSRPSSGPASPCSNAPACCRDRAQSLCGSRSVCD
jgi:predicted kinase